MKCLFRRAGGQSPSRRRPQDVGLIHLFALAQIGGYALGGCWAYIGSAQSVVAYSFIRKELDPRYTPFAWIKAMIVLLLEIAALMTVVVYAEGWLIARGIMQ